MTHQYTKRRHIVCPESLQGAEEFTQSVDLSVGGIGNGKDKSLQQLKSSFLLPRAFGIFQISQILPSLLSETRPQPLTV